MISSAMPYQKHYQDVNGKRIAYIDEGEGDPIVLLHGNPGGSGDTRGMTRDRRLQEFAARHGFGLVGVAWFPGGEVYRETGALMLQVLDCWAEMGFHPELRNVPIVARGSSNAGQISCRQLQVALLSLSERSKKDVGQDGHRVALLDDGLDARETSLELALLDGELHLFSSLVDGVGEVVEVMGGDNRQSERNPLERDPFFSVTPAARTHWPPMDPPIAVDVTTPV